MNRISEASEMQDEIIAILSCADFHPGGESVKIAQTYGAIVILSRHVALKTRRAARYGHMNLPTLDLRKTMIRWEPAPDELSIVADQGRLVDGLARDAGQSVFDCHIKTPQRITDGATPVCRSCIRNGADGNSPCYCSNNPAAHRFRNPATAWSFILNTRISLKDTSPLSQNMAPNLTAKASFADSNKPAKPIT